MGKSAETGSKGLNFRKILEHDKLKAVISEAGKLIRTIKKIMIINIIIPAKIVSPVELIVNNSSYIINIKLFLGNTT